MAKHLTKEERIKIETLLSIGQTADEIASHLNRHRSTIYRELNRPGVCDKKYNAEQYHNQARTNMSREVLTGPSTSTIALIHQKIIEEQWSPEQISNWLELHGYPTVSHTWIYQYIEQDKKEGGELHNHMRRGRYTRGHKEYKGKIKNRVSIEERPSEVNQRTRLGDYEIDLIVGPKNKGAILTIIDRLSRECILEKLDNKAADTVRTATIKLLTPKKDNAYTLTSDNGTEFTEHTEIAQELGIKYFFAHPYASYERGSIENLNGLVRQYIPKGTHFNDITHADIKLIQDKLNRRPRKILGFLTPIEYTTQYNSKVDLSHLNL